MHRPWDELTAYYTELVDVYGHGPACAALGDLCRRIGKSHLAAGLFGHTSIATLGLSQTATDFPPAKGHQILRLTPDGTDIIFELKHFGVKESKPWTRRVPATELPQHFDKYLRQLSWNYHPISEQ